MKKSLGEIMSDPRIWEMSEEEKQRGRQRIMEIAKREMESHARGQVPDILKGFPETSGRTLCKTIKT